MENARSVQLPIGEKQNFKGVVDLQEGLYGDGKTGQTSLLT
jgi:hypothetical protein